MSLLDSTLEQLAPGVVQCRDLDGRYRPRHGLAIYCLPVEGWAPSSPGMVLGEALAGRSGIGCTLLEGVPAKVPEGAAVVALYKDLMKIRPDLLEDVPEPANDSEYCIKLGRNSLIVANTTGALAQGMQTLAMIVLRHGEETIPGCVIVDRPARAVRCLAIELESREIGINLLMQIASFAATFKANQLHFILNDDFEPAREIPGMDNFFAVCGSFGIDVGVRLKHLGKILSGEMSVAEAWSRIRAAARVFGATIAALDDVCPGDANPETLRRLVESAAAGDTGLAGFSLDARAIVISGVEPAKLAPAGIAGWHRLWKSAVPPPPEFAGIPLAIDVQAPVTGLTSRGLRAYRVRLDVALRDFAKESADSFMISFRDVGISHMWQNLLYPAGTGLITAWGVPDQAELSADRLLSLLYGEAGPVVANMWDVVTEAFPPGLPDDAEVMLRRTAFGHWPAGPEEWRTLTRVDWLTVAEHIRHAAQTVQAAFNGLSRNVSTLMGARLCLYAMSWLHCLTALVPELEARLDGRMPEDGRTEHIIKELFNNYHNWLNCMRETQQESGLEFSELPVLEEMGVYLRSLCEDVVEKQPDYDNGGLGGSLTLA